MIIIYDYGVGNNVSIKNIINRIGLSAEITSEISQVEQASFCIIPGVGSFDTCISSFLRQDSSEVLLKRISGGHMKVVIPLDILVQWLLMYIEFY